MKVISKDNFRSHDQKILAGESGVGESNPTNSERCCGDDAKEFNTYRDCIGAACTTDTNDKRCCDTSTDCVYNGACYSYNAVITAGAQNIRCVGENQWAIACANLGELCDNPAGTNPACCSGYFCHDMDRQFIPPPSPNPVDYYRCAVGDSDCVDDVSDGDSVPYLHNSGQVYSNSQMLCCNGKIYRCASHDDAWMAQPGPKYTCRQHNICGKTCITGPATYIWSTPPAEACCYNYDDDCDGLVDGTDPDCEESNAKANCNDGIDNDCDGKTDREDLPDCCIYEGNSCTISKSYQCCDYTGSADDPHCRIDTAKCGTTSACDPPACDTNYWSVECIIGEDWACCSSAYMGYPELDDGIPKPIVPY